MCITLIPITVMADEGAYTVTLDPGDGTGEPITYSCPFDEYDNLPEYSAAGHLQFYKEENYVVGFKLNDDYCPDSFTAPDKYLFDGWDGMENSRYLRVTKGNPNKTLTARWKVDKLKTYGPINDIPKADGGNIWLGGIKWRVIGQSDSESLLISADLLGDEMLWNDAKAYCDTVYNGFSLLEQNAVIPTTKADGSLDSDIDWNYETFFGQNGVEFTLYYPAALDNAKLFLLSAAEADYYFNSDEDRQPGWWWLRSECRFDYETEKTQVGVVSGGGRIVCNDVLVINSVRPAFRFDPSTVLFESLAENGKPAPGSGFAEYTEPTNSSDRKLTLLDSSRNNFTAVQAGNVCPGGRVNVLYYNAPTGANEYVSAMICDTAGTPLYYASTPSEGDGVMDLVLPIHLDINTSYILKVFSEQRNGDCATDYASEFKTITLNTTVICVATFKNYDNTNLQTCYVALGQTPKYTGATPEKPSNNLRFGYVFDGWDPELGPVTNSNPVYTAQFRQEAKNLVTFDGNGGTGAMTTDSYFIDEGTYTLPKCSFTAPDGYMFDNWLVEWDNADGSTTAQYRGPGYTLSGLTKDIRLTAQWKQLSVRVSPENAGTAIYENGSFTATSNAGYTFKEWDYYPDDSGVVPIDYDPLLSTNNRYTPDTVEEGVYYAVFTANEYDLTVDINNNAWGNVTYTGTPKTGNTIRLTVTPNDGYKLASLTYTPEDGEPVKISSTDSRGRYIFTMPAANVTVSVLFAPENGDPQFVAHSLVLTGEIGVSFLVECPIIDGMDYTDCYMTFEISGKGSVSSEKILPNEGTTDNQFCFTCYVNSIQMADTITATFHYGDGQTISDEYSVKQYISDFDAIMDKARNDGKEPPYDETTEKLVHALADYGHYLQPFLSEARGWTIGNGDDQYAEMSTVYTTGYDIDSIKSAVADYAIGRAYGTDIEKINFTLLMDSDTSIYLYFKPASEYDGSFSVTVDGRAATATKQADGRYLVRIPNIVAHKLDVAYTVVAKTDNDRTSVTVSALSYVNWMLDAEEYQNNTLAQNGVASIYAYYIAAKEYKQEHP